jgi:CheY-like chemotaxis protein
MLATLLTLSGYPVVSAANGAEGLTLARQHRPRLVLLDLMMPIMDGPQFRAEQLADPSLSCIPVLCISGRHDAQDVARELQASGCLQKPIQVDSLMTQVESICGPPGADDFNQYVRQHPPQ